MLVAERELAGSVEAVDQNGVARVLIGPAEEEWFFPLDLLPEGTDAGDVIRFADRDGRYIVVGKAEVPVPTLSIEDRLSRPLNTKRTAEFEAGELQAMARSAAKPATITDRAATPAPVRTRASRQRRW